MPGRVERAPVVVVLDERLDDPYFVQPRPHALSSRYWIEAGFAVAISQRADSLSRFQR
jgi:hypothetical protein